MAYRVIETELALRDLDGILEYLAVSLNSPSAASALADDIGKCLERLEKMPFMFEACTDPRLQRLGYRKVVIRNYILVYKVDEFTETVIVLRFFYGRQNYENLI